MPDMSPPYDFPPPLAKGNQPMTLDQIEAKVKALMSQHIGIFSNIDELKAEIFELFVQLINHLKSLEAKK